jgi:hypothetical protein
MGRQDEQTKERPSTSSGRADKNKRDKFSFAKAMAGKQDNILRQAQDERIRTSRMNG